MGWVRIARGRWTERGWCYGAQPSVSRTVPSSNAPRGAVRPIRRLHVRSRAGHAPRRPTRTVMPTILHAFRWVSQSLLVASLLSASGAASQTLGVPLGVFADVEGCDGISQLRDGRVLVTSGATQVLAFETDGTPLGVFASGLTQPSGTLELDGGRILIVEGGRSENAEVYALDGTYVGPFGSGLNVAVDAIQLADGRVLIAEYGDGSTGRVSQFDPDGTPRGSVCTPTRQPHRHRPTRRRPRRRPRGVREPVSAFAPDRTPLEPFVGSRVPRQRPPPTPRRPRPRRRGDRRGHRARSGSRLQRGRHVPRPVHDRARSGRRARAPGRRPGPRLRRRERPGPRLRRGAGSERSIARGLGRGRGVPLASGGGRSRTST